MKGSGACKFKNSSPVIILNRISFLPSHNFKGLALNSINLEANGIIFPNKNHPIVIPIIWFSLKLYTVILCYPADESAHQKCHAEIVRCILLIR